MKSTHQNTVGNLLILSLLRKIALTCVYLQSIAALFFLFCFSVINPSHTLSVICGILAILISLTPLIYALIKKVFLTAFSCIAVFNLAPIWFLYLEASLAGYDAYVYSPPIYKVEAFFWISIFQLSVNFFYLFFSRQIGIRAINWFSFLRRFSSSSAFFLQASFVSFIVPLVLFGFYYGSIETLWDIISAGRSGGGTSSGLIIQDNDSRGSSSSLMNPINWWWQLTPVFSALGFFSSKEKSNVLPILSLVVAFAVIFVFFLSGARGGMMAAAAPMLFFLFYYNWNKGVKFWSVAILLLFIFIGIMELQVRFRGNLLDVLLDPTKAAKAEGLASATSFDPMQSHRDNNMYLLCLVVKGYPGKYNFEGLNDFFTLIVNPIPRVIWPNKPVWYGTKELIYQWPFILDGPLFMGTTSLSFSIVGDAYQAKGFWGIILYSFIFAFLLFVFDNLHFYTRDNILSVGVLGISCFVAFWGYRSLYALITGLYPLLFLLLLVRILTLLKRKF
jgi:hypothetical protein